MACCAALSAAAGLPVGAQEPVSPAEFEAMATGRTLYFSRDGLPFGAEQYFSGRRTLWRFFDGTCDAGRWEPRGELVCFSYATDPDWRCWRLWREDGRLAAVLVVEGADTGSPLRLDRTDETDLACPGPDVGS